MRSVKGERMAGDQRDFTCVVEHRFVPERFSAKVTVSKKFPIRKSLQHGQMDLADVFITPISGNRVNVHSHFVIYDFTGRGLYIVRDARNRDEYRLQCTVWDLGSNFATQVMTALGDLA
jgi:hypothetical protein